MEPVLLFVPGFGLLICYTYPSIHRSQTTTARTSCLHLNQMQVRPFLLDLSVLLMLQLIDVMITELYA